LGLHDYQRFARRALELALLTAAVFVLSGPAAGALPSGAPLWPAAGLGLGAALVFGPRALVAVALGSLLAGATSAPGPVEALAATAAATAGAAGGRFAAGRCGLRDGRVRTAGDAAALLAGGCLGGAAAAASVGVGVLTLAARAPEAGAASGWFSWWLGDFAGAALLAPVLLVWTTGPRRLGRRAASRIGAGAAAAALAWVALEARWPGAELAAHALPFAIFPLTGAAAFALGRHGATAATLLGSALVVRNAGRGLGPFTLAADDVLYLQCFLVVVSGTGLSLAAVLAERRRAEAALCEREQLLRMTLEASRVGTWEWIPATDRLTVASGRADAAAPESERFDGTLQELLGRFAPAGRDDLERAVRHALESEDGAFRAELQIAGPNGRVRWLASAGRLFRDGYGTATRMLGTVVDVTERHDRARRADEERTLRLSRLGRARRMEALGHLSGGVAHDINNLLTAVLGNAEILSEVLGRRGDLEPAARDAIEQLRLAGERSAALARQLVGLRRGAAAPARVADPARLLGDLESGLRDLLGTGVDLSVRCDTAGSAVRVAPAQLEQVLTHLTTNARDAMFGGGHLRIELERAAGPDRAGTWVRLRVADTGVGMPPAVAERVFDPFFTTKPVGQGAGLGLTTVYGIVSSAGGWVDLDSAPGAGTRVDVFLPASPGIPEGEVSSARAPARTTVLVCEDDDAVRALIVRLLESSGHRVLDVADPDAAERIASRERRIDLLVTDLVLPGRDGNALWARLSARRPELRVLFVTGNSDAASAAHPCLRKPFSAAMLLRRVQDVLDDARALA